MYDYILELFELTWWLQTWLNVNNISNEIEFLDIWTHVNKPLIKWSISTNKNNTSLPYISAPFYRLPLKWIKDIFELINKIVIQEVCMTCMDEKETTFFTWQPVLTIQYRSVAERQRQPALSKYRTAIRNWELSNRTNDYSNIFRVRGIWSVGYKFVWYSLLTLVTLGSRVNPRRVLGQ